MEKVISNLVKSFEKGVLTRRQLIRGLAMLTGAGAASSARRLIKNTNSCVY